MFWEYHFYESQRKKLLEDASNEIENLSTEIILSFMEPLSVPDYDLDMTLDSYVDEETETETILNRIVYRLKNTIPFVIDSVRVIPGLRTNPRAKKLLASIWFFRFVSKTSSDFILFFIDGN